MLFYSDAERGVCVSFWAQLARCVSRLAFRKALSGIGSWH